MASKKKKVVTKDDLRRLMKEKQSVVKSGSKKIEHPLAKYNSLDQLVCVLCNNVIKSGLLWPAHIQSRAHKEKLDEYKHKQTEPQPKRKAADLLDTGPLKKPKGSSSNGSNTSGVPSDFFDKGSKPGGGKPIKSILSNSTAKPLLSQYSDSESEEEEEERETTQPARITTLASALKNTNSNALPPDFFDAGVMPSASTSKEPDPDPKPATMAETLPEGFFDDPKMDAKVRKVEYVDKMEEEWELFQRSMKEETHVSEAIIEEEDEQVNVDRVIEEIDQQIQCFKEVNDLQNKKDEIMKNGPQATKQETDSDDELNEAKLDEFLDWRSKKSWR